MNLHRLYVVGVMTGSMERRERSRMGVEWDIAGSTMLWRIVGIIKGVGQKYEGRARRLCESERLDSVIGVRISLRALAG